MNKRSLYFVIGVITYAMANLLLYIFRRVLGLPDSLSVMVSYALVTVCHFLFHNNFTFKGSEEPLRNKVRGHIAVSVINYLVGVAVVTVTIKYIVDSSIAATAFSTLITFFIGFTLLNRFVYKLDTEKGVRKES